MNEGHGILVRGVVGAVGIIPCTTSYVLREVSAGASSVAQSKVSSRTRLFVVLNADRDHDAAAAAAATHDDGDTDDAHWCCYEAREPVPAEVEHDSQLAQGGRHVRFFTSW